MANIEGLSEVAQETAHRVIEKTKKVIGRVSLSMALMITTGSAGAVVQEIYHANENVAFADSGSYPWADAEHIPQPPAHDNITWGYNSKSTCDNKSSDFDCNGETVGAWSYRDQWGYDLRNCTSYAAWRVAKEFGISVAGWGNADTWDDHARAAGYSVDNTPEPGDLAVWDSMHVAYVEEVRADGYSRVSEYNQRLDGNFRNDRWIRADHYIDLNGSNSINAPLPPPPPYKKGDFNYDGKADIAWFEKWQNSISLLRSSNGQFQPEKWQTGIGGPDWAGVGDFDGNKFADIAWYEQWQNKISVLVNHGGWFSIETFNTGIGKPDWAGVGDFDGDGRDDLAWYEQSLNKLTILGSTGNTFSPMAVQTGLGGPTWAGVGDFDGNGLADVAWYEQWQNKASVLINHGAGAFSIHAFMTGLGGPDWAGVGDFDGDKKDDIAWYQGWQNSISVLHSNGSAFEVWGGFPGVGGPDWAGVGDYDGDGKDDIAWFEKWQNAITMLKGNEPGDFTASKWATGIGGPDWAGSRNGSPPNSNGR